MASRSLTPLGAAARGVAAAVAGTAAMTAAQTAYYKATGTESSSTPAEVARRIVEGVLQRDLPEERMSALNQGTHWLYGSSWGLLYGIVAGSRRRPASVVASGTALALAVWSTGRAELTAMQLAPPPWQDPPSSLAVDLGSHLVYGVTSALAFRVLR